MYWLEQHFTGDSMAYKGGGKGGGIEKREGKRKPGSWGGYEYSRGTRPKEEKENRFFEKETREGGRHLSVKKVRKTMPLKI